MDSNYRLTIETAGVTLEWFFQLAHSQMGNCSNFMGIVKQLESGTVGSTNTETDFLNEGTFKACVRHRRVSDVFDSLSWNHRCVLTATYEYIPNLNPEVTKLVPDVGGLVYALRSVKALEALSGAKKSGLSAVQKLEFSKLRIEASETLHAALTAFCKKWNGNVVNKKEERYGN